MGRSEWGVPSTRRDRHLVAIETHSLTRYYGDLCAVDHLDLTVQQGELLAFLGPNGAGKTTTIRMLTGLIRPTEGSALINGYDVLRDPLMVKAQVGVVPQRSNLYAELSARENLIFCGQLYGLPRRRWRSRADELLEEFELTEQADMRFEALSGGMKRRLTIAAALVHAPRILFLDEPTTGLDVRSARGLRATIARLRGDGVTIFLTTHLIQEAERLADRVAIIVRGTLRAVGTPAELCARCAEEQALRVRVSGPSDEALLSALNQLPSVLAISRDGEWLRLTVHSVDAALWEMGATLRQIGRRIEDIQTVRPSLEDAFVQITHLDSEIMQINVPQRGRGQ
ncbi:MAG: ABC transporter ATP-binding protein [Chloroflexi bacterium]|nr:ABC transporter ATP-binding protein [Chloroflexota bacterium]